MFEALLSLYEATKSEEVWYEINQELKAIERLFDHKIGYLPEGYDENWKPVGNPSGNPGHLFEWASLLSRAVELGADPKFIELGSRNLDLGLKSYNEAVGGLGGVERDGQPSQMLWWPQCEVIKATANYAILHGRTELWPYFHKTLEFVKKEYFDTEHGGWFADYVPGQPRVRAAAAGLLQGLGRRSRMGRLPPDLDVYEHLWRITDPDYKAWPTEAVVELPRPRSHQREHIGDRFGDSSDPGSALAAWRSGGQPPPLARRDAAAAAAGSGRGGQGPRQAGAGRPTAAADRSGDAGTGSGTVFGQLRLLSRFRSAGRRVRTESAPVAR